MTTHSVPGVRACGALGRGAGAARWPRDAGRHQRGDQRLREGRALARRAGPPGHDGPGTGPHREERGHERVCGAERCGEEGIAVENANPLGYFGGLNTV